MNRRLFITYIVATIIIVAVIYIYKSRNASSLSTPSAPDTSSLQQEAVQPSRPPLRQPSDYSHDKELISKYTAQITAGEDDGGNAYYQRALVYQHMQQYKSAIKDFTSALELSNNSPRVLYGRALAYQQERMPDNAIIDLSNAIKLKSDFIEAYNLRGVMYDSQGNFKDALADYNNAIALDPNFEQAYFNLGTLYIKQKNLTEAKTAFDDAIKYNVPAQDALPDEIAIAQSNLLQSYLGRSRVNLFLNDLKAALDDVNFVITHDSTNADAYKLRAIIYEKMGDSASAASDYATSDNLSIHNMLNNNR